MAIRRSSKLNPNFNMSSMTDIVFLLLIFFLVTSTLVNPNALKLLLPKSTNQLTNRASVTVSIDQNRVYYFNAKVTPFTMLENKIVDALKNAEDPCITIQAEKSVPIEYVVRITSFAYTVTQFFFLFTLIT